MPRIQVCAGDGMYFYSIGRSLPHERWKNEGSGPILAERDCSYVWGSL